MISQPLTYLIRTISIDTDDRLLKTCSFLRRSGIDLEVCAVVNECVPQSADEPIKQVELSLRKTFASGRLTLLKYLELLWRIGYYIQRRPGRRWFVNYDFLPLHLIYLMGGRCCDRPYWDLHEMPPTAMSKVLPLRVIFSFLLRRSLVIVCNDARRKALEELFQVDLGSAVVLRNFPDAASVSRLRSARNSWLRSQSAARDPYRIIIIGGDVPGRYVRESISVVASLRTERQIDLEVHLIGGQKWDGPEDFVYSTGRVPLAELLKRCVTGGTSLCFYSRHNINNRLCEPNRFYQALIAGQHVVTFCHPSLQDIGYPWHHVIDENNFAADLSACLLLIFQMHRDPLRRLEWSQTSQSSTIIFEAQYQKFSDWFLKE